MKTRRISRKAKKEIHQFSIKEIGSYRVKIGLKKSELLENRHDRIFISFIVFLSFLLSNYPLIVL